MSSGYYPAGAENDPNAPYNEVEREEERDAYIDVLWTRECEEHEVDKLVEELVTELRNRKDVDPGDYEYEFDDGELTVFASPTITVTATAYGNYITCPDPEVDEEDIDNAVDEQYEDILKVNNWTLDKQ